jgi:hypothetical protein
MDLAEADDEEAGTSDLQAVSPPRQIVSSPELTDGKDGGNTPSPWKMAGTPGGDGADSPGGKFPRSLHHQRRPCFVVDQRAWQSSPHERRM